MIKLLKLTFVLIVLTGCEQTIDTQKIAYLENENRKLKDSLSKLLYDRVISSEIVLLPHTLSFELNSKNKITGVFSQNQHLPPYDLYFADEDYTYDEKDKIDFSKIEYNKFEFEFTPKNNKEETVRVVAVFNLDSVKAKLTGRTDLPVK